MSQRMSLKKLQDFLDDSRQKVDQVARELEEVQLQLVSVHQVAKGKHDATLGGLGQQTVQQLAACPPEIQQAFEQRLAVEDKTLADRWRDLADRLVPQAEQIADDLLARAQKATAKVRSLNPRLNEEEEKLKAQREKMSAELTQLNDQIKRLSGCLTLPFNFFKLNKIDRQRQKLLGRMEENARKLSEVREQWSKVSTDYSAEQTQLQSEWEQACLDAARMREEMSQLGEDAKRDSLAARRAIFYVFDHWKTPLPGGGNGLTAEINRMVQLNIQTDEYEDGLGKVAGGIALLRGVSQGLQSLSQSVEALIKEQAMHASYLKPVDVSVDDAVLNFHKGWDALRNKVKDEKALAENPTQFSALLEAEVQGWLSKANIECMFNALSQALTAATKGWKG